MMGAAVVLLAGTVNAHQQQQHGAALRGGAATGLADNASDERPVAELQEFLEFAEMGADGGVVHATYDKGQQQGGGSGSLAPLLEIYMDPRGVADRSPSKHWLFPACGFAAPILESPVYCPLGLAVERIGEAALQRDRGDFIVAERTMYETEKEPAQGLVPLPVRLHDVGHPIPFQIQNQTVVEAERQTYYWYLRNIINLYLYIKRCIIANSDHALPPPYVPNGWYVGAVRIDSVAFVDRPPNSIQHTSTISSHQQITGTTSASSSRPPRRRTPTRPSGRASCAATPSC
jgi:hypothetical protein